MSMTHEIVQEMRELAEEFRSLKLAMLYVEDEEELIELVQRLEALAADLGSD